MRRVLDPEDFYHHWNERNYGKYKPGAHISASSATNLKQQFILTFFATTCFLDDKFFSVAVF